MAKHVETGISKKPFNIETKNDTWIFDESFSVKQANRVGIYVDTEFAGNRILFNGTASGNPIAIGALAKNTEIVIGESAKFSGNGAAAIYGDNSSISNAADMSGLQVGFYVGGGAHQRITNEGTIQATIAITTSSEAHEVTIINAKGGVFVGRGYGIDLESINPGEVSRIENHGSLSGKLAAITTSAGAETVLNTGDIKGAILLGSDDDTFRNDGGTINNASKGISGNDGDDTLITDNAKIALIEQFDEGDDTVKSTVSYTLSDNVENLFLLGKKDLKGIGEDSANLLHGNTGDNVLKGMLGADHLYGGKGDDTLFGGGDADTFHFSAGDGKDTVADFENGFDTVDISGLETVVDFTDLIENHTEFKNGDAIITVGKDVLTIKNVTEMELDDTDFEFVA